MSLLLKGDCCKIMEAIKPTTVDAIICDPPYGLEFMGKDWDRLNLEDIPKGYIECEGNKSIIKKKMPRFHQTAEHQESMQLWHAQWLTEAYRVLKPGGSMLVMGGTRTSHRLACAIEDSGFIIKDTLMWIYGSGFPKAQDLGKMIDKRKNWCNPKRFAELIKKKRLEKRIFITQMDKDVCNGTTNYSWFEGRPAGIRLPRLKEYQKIKEILELDNKWDSYFEEAERKIIGKSNRHNSYRSGSGNTIGFQIGIPDVTAPSTDLAKHWDGFKVGGIKPAYEPIIWAVKPPEGSYVDNVLKWGVGAVNVDECRVGYDSPADKQEQANKNPHTIHADNEIYGDYSMCKKPWKQPKGRFPANVILSHHSECVQLGVKKDIRSGGFGKGKRPWQKGQVGKNTQYIESETESWRCHPDCAVRLLDEQSGSAGQKVKPGYIRKSAKTKDVYGKYRFQNNDVNYADNGGASRFYYCAKASRGERNAGLEGMKEKEATTYHDESIEGAKNRGRNPRHNNPVKNNHPTVKPIKLFEWLIKLVTREGQIILDPFIGSGTSAIAAHNTSRKCVGIDKEGEYLEIARRRISYWRAKPRQLALGE